jgi:hypothetical protein
MSLLCFTVEIASFAFFAKLSCKPLEMYTICDGTYKMRE